MSDKFRFLEKLGEGKFGEVWLALDKTLNYQCAVKCIPPDKVINPNNFFHEAQLLKTAEHPNIVRVNETGRLEDNRIYVSMEYLKNGSIANAVDLDYTFLRKTILAITGVLRGLDYAHSKGITHRDIKPSNILLGESFDGKLSDFGLALPRLSQFDQVLVKHYFYPTHLAPEVRSGRDYTASADIFACGLTLYRLINGDMYFQQGDFSAHREFIPPALVKVIEKAIAPDSAKRYQSATELRHALEQITVCVDWAEEPCDKGTRWTFINPDDSTCIVERMQETDGTWSITTRKGTNGKSLRRDSKLCQAGLVEKIAIRETKKILQGFVSGKYR